MASESRTGTGGPSQKYGPRSLFPAHSAGWEGCSQYTGQLDSPPRCLPCSAYQADAQRGQLTPSCGHSSAYSSGTCGIGAKKKGQCAGHQREGSPHTRAPASQTAGRPRGAAGLRTAAQASHPPCFVDTKPRQGFLRGKRWSLPRGGHSQEAAGSWQVARGWRSGRGGSLSPHLSSAQL